MEQSRKPYVALASSILPFGLLATIACLDTNTFSHPDGTTRDHGESTVTFIAHRTARAVDEKRLLMAEASPERAASLVDSTDGHPQTLCNTVMNRVQRRKTPR